jgi:signal peptidase I
MADASAETTFLVLTPTDSLRVMADQKSGSSPWWIRLAVGRRPRRTLARAGFLLLSSLVTFKFLIFPIRVVGISMIPAYRNGTVNLVNRISYSNSKPRRGDVVAIRMAGEKSLLLKRIIALPGERLAIRRGVVTINGVPLAEPYVLSNRTWNSPEIHLRDNEYFVIGDNRTMDQRWHDFGVRKREDILGKVIF